MKRIIGLLILLNSTMIYSMDEQFVKVPKKSRTNDKAKIIMQHAGSSQNNVKVQALLAAFKQMEKDPTLIMPQPSESDSFSAVELEEQVPSNFEHLKQLWHFYRQTAKEMKKTDESQVSEQRMFAEQRKQKAQEVIDKALELLNEQQNAAVTSNKRQKYVIAGIAAIGYLLSAGIGAYLKFNCDQSCSANSM